MALGRAEWTPDDVHHLGECRSCQCEWALLQTANRLGERAAAGIDVASITTALQRRRGRTPGRNRQRKAWGVAGMAAAAALAGLLWSGRADPPLPPPPSTHVVAGLQIPLPELEDLQPAELDSVLRGMDRPGPYIDILETIDSGAAEAPELETVYDYWEG
ncbi:MAG TPA: hypothetical protein VFH24_00385 [Gemmatimonadales bacterium]|nr:hypothetical protein [Gemmatimonadales bacterium]